MSAKRARPSMDFDIHDLVKLRTNLWLSNLPPYFRVDSIDPNFEIQVVERIDATPSGSPRRAVGFTAHAMGDDEILFECDPPIFSLFGMKARWKLLLGDLGGDATTLTTAVPFFDFRPVRFRARQMLSRLARLIFIIKLVRRGFAVCHATALSQGDRAHLFLGYSGTGKSTIAASLIASGYDFLADDFAIVNGGGDVYCYPDWQKPHTLRPQLPVRKYVAGRPSHTADRLPVRDRARIDSVVLLERGPDRILELDREEAIRRVMLLNMAELARLLNSPISVLLNYYGYFYPSLDLDGIVAAHRLLLVSFLRNAKRYVTVQSSTPDFPAVSELLDGRRVLPTAST